MCVSVRVCLIFRFDLDQPGDMHFCHHGSDKASIRCSTVLSQPENACSGQPIICLQSGLTPTWDCHCGSLKEGHEFFFFF